MPDLQVRSTSIALLLRYHAERQPDAEALLSPDRIPLTYRRLWEHVQKTVERLHEAGLGSQDRIALVLPDGPDSATAQFAAASFATACPINPGYRCSEFETFFI